MKHKKVFALVVLVIVFGMVFTSLLVQSASAINMTVSGNVVSNEYRADFDGQTFLGDEIMTSEFYYNWTSETGFIKIYTAKGLVTINMEDAEYDAMSYKFTISKFTYAYPTGYPYKITLSQIWGDQTSSNFTGYMVGSYTETGSSEEEEGEDCEDCCDVKHTNDSTNKVLRIEVRGDKDISSAGAVMYLSDGTTSSGNLSKVTDRMYITNYPYGDIYPTAFSISVIFEDGDPFTDYITVSTGSSSWSGWSGGSTSSDYTSALNTAKAKGFTTVVALINDMNTSIKNKNEQIQTQQTTLAQRNAELESARSSSTNYQQLFQNEQTAKNTINNQLLELQRKYDALFKENGGQTETTIPSVTKEIDMRYIAGILGLLIVGGILYKKKKFPFKKGKKFDVHKNNGMPREPVQNNHRNEPEYPPVPEDIYYTPNVDRIIDENTQREN
jgi:hypothetical protein